MTPEELELLAQDLAAVWRDLPCLGSFIEIKNTTPGEPGRTDFGYDRWSESQRLFERHRTGRDIVLKSRQSWFSTLEHARNVQYVCTHEAVQVLIIVDDREEKAKFFARLKMMLDSLARWGMIPPRSAAQYDTKTEIVFGANGSAIYITEAGSSAGAAKKTGRSGTIDRFHGTEVAFWRSPKETWTSVDGAFEHGDEGVLETTAQGADTWFHATWLAAVEGRFSGFAAHFFPWFSVTSRRRDPSVYATPGRTSRERRWEDRLVKDIGISPEQLAWWRAQVESKGLDDVLTEYPPTPEAAFQGVRDSWVDAESLDELDRRVRAPRRLMRLGRAQARVYLEPMAGVPYIMAADVSDGVGADEASIVIVEHLTGAVAVVWDDQWTRPSELARDMDTLGRLYNNALAAPEIEGLRTASREPIGRVVLKALLDLGYRWIFRDPRSKTRQLGWATNKRTRTQMLEDLRDAIMRQEVWSPDRKMVAEARSMARDKTGKVRARGKHSSGGDDGVFFAWAIGHQVQELASARRPGRAALASVVGDELESAGFQT